jgi:hypothetical protein
LRDFRRTKMVTWAYDLVGLIQWQICNTRRENHSRSMDALDVPSAVVSCVRRALVMQGVKMSDHLASYTVLMALGMALSVEPAAAAVAPVPGPIVGAGLPGLAILGGVYGAIWLTRKLRNRRSAD